MSEDTRCCGTGTCIIDAQGRCWCGQEWDGKQMCRPAMLSGDSANTAPASTHAADGSDEAA